MSVKTDNHQRFIVRFRGKGHKPLADVKRIGDLCGVTVLDDSSPRMLLVDAPAAELTALVERMPGWMVSLERAIGLPDPRPRIRHAPHVSSEPQR